MGEVSVFFKGAPSSRLTMFNYGVTPMQVWAAEIGELCTKAKGGREVWRWLGKTLEELGRGVGDEYDQTTLCARMRFIINKSYIVKTNGCP